MMVADFGPDTGCQFGGISRSAYLFRWPVRAWRGSRRRAELAERGLGGAQGLKAPHSF